MNTREIWTDSRIWALALAETTIWAGIFYVFPPLILRWNDHFGWSISEISLGLTFALVASAITSVLAGRLIDKGWSKLLMTGSSLFAVILMLLLTQITELWQFYLLWILTGVTFAGCLYDPCFSHLTREFDKDAKKAIIMVTLFAGFASTISYPTYSFFSDNYSWEAGIYFFSILICLFTAPLFWYGTSSKDSGFKERWFSYKANQFEKSTTPKTPFSSTIVPVIKTPVFWALFAGLASFPINQGMLGSQIFPILESVGTSKNQALIFASFIGPMQVVARLILFVSESTLSKNISMVHAAIFCLSCLAISSLILVLGTGSTLTILIFVVLQGGPQGIVSIIKPVLTAELLGRSNFGVVASTVGIGSILSFALSPAIAGVIADKWSYDSVLMTTFSISLIGIVSLLLTFKFKDKNPDFDYI
ncbi:MAG: MFS transporter [Dehalococcoidia bacterium]